MLFDSVDECLRAVADGKVDSTLINALRTDHYLRNKNRFKNLTAVQIPGGLPLGFAVLTSQNGTTDILNHGISLMDPDFALKNTYKYEGPYQMTTVEFIKNNMWLPTIMLFVIGMLIVAFFYLQLKKDRKYLEKEKKQNEAKAAEEAIVRSLTSIYFTALEITLSDGKNRVIRISEFMKDSFKVDGMTFADVKEKYIELCVDPLYRNTVREFLNYDTLVERIEKQGFIKKNYFGLTQGWCRITVVPVRNKETNAIEKIVFAI